MLRNLSPYLPMLSLCAALALVGMVAYLVNRVNYLSDLVVGIETAASAGTLAPNTVVSVYNAATGQTVHVSAQRPQITLAPGIDRTAGSAVRLVAVSGSHEPIRGGDSVLLLFVSWGLFYSAQAPSRLTDRSEEATPVRLVFGSAPSSRDFIRPTSELKIVSGSGDDGGAWVDISQKTPNVLLLPFVNGTTSPAAAPPVRVLRQ